MRAPSSRPAEFETVAQHRHHDEGVPDRAKPVELAGFRKYVRQQLRLRNSLSTGLLASRVF